VEAVLCASAFHREPAEARHSLTARFPSISQQVEVLEGEVRNDPVPAAVMVQMARTAVIHLAWPGSLLREQPTPRRRAPVTTTFAAFFDCWRSWMHQEIGLTA
jgi:hypothetical protein